MRKHNTEEEKSKRRKAYNKLIAAGIPTKSAYRIRDWTDNKVELVANGNARPVFLLFEMEKIKQYGNLKKH